MYLPRFLNFSIKGAVFPDAFTHKYVTAQVFDELGTWHIFPLREKYVMDGKFLVRIGKRMILLNTDLTKMKTYRYRGSKPVQTLLYTSRDAKPFDPDDLDTIREFCETNGISKINHMQAILIQAYAMLAQDHREQAIGFDDVIEQMIAPLAGKKTEEEIAEKKAEYLDVIRDLGTKKLKGPLEPINKYLGRRMQDNPNTMANTIVNLKSANYEWKDISHPAKSPFSHWLLVAIIIGVTAAAGIGLWVLSGGTGDLNTGDLKMLAESGLTPEQLGFTVGTDEPPEQGNDIFDFVANTTESVLEGDVLP